MMDTAVIVVTTYILLGAIAWAYIGKKTGFTSEKGSRAYSFMQNIWFIFTWYTTFLELAVRESRTLNPEDVIQKAEEAME